MKRILSCLCVLVLLSVAAAVPAMADTYAEVTAPLPDREVYSAPWPAAYEQILTTYCDGILNYQETLYEAYIDGEYAEVPCRPVALEDLDEDGIPELVFLEFLEDECLGNLYVFTSDADSARCALFIPGVTLLGYDDWLEFRIYMTEDHGEALAVEFYQYETPWILTFARNAENRYELVTCLTYRVDNSGEDEDNEFFRNGENITETEYWALLDEIRSGQTRVITALREDCAWYGLGLTLDETFTALGEEFTGNSAQAQGPVYGLAIQRLATRKGPGTQYAGGGTYNVKGQYIQILSRAYDKKNGTWWVKCVIPYRGKERVLWTGYKRFDQDQLPLESIPLDEEY